MASSGVLPESVIDPLRAVLPRAVLRNATRIGEGYGSVAYLVPDQSGDWAVRIPRAEADWAIPALEREARLLPALANYIDTAETPRDARIVHAADGSVVVAAVHRYVPGRQLSSRSVRGRRRDRLTEQVGAFLSQLHGFPLDQAQALGVPELDLWEDHYRPLIDQAMQYLGVSAQQWLAAQAEAFESGGGTRSAPRVLIHGDISGNHLLLDGDSGLGGVIDFGDAMIADPALDLAGLLNDMAEPFLDQVREHYLAELDADARRRVRFYIDVAAIHQVIYGDRVQNGQERTTGVRRLAAKAASDIRYHGK
jgi:aminoglycoside phosphotransferase (APT) family kinase protein